MDKHTPEQRRRNMQAVRNSDSKIEIALRHELWARGLHYRKNVRSVYGCPDIAFLGKKVAVFCDSEFWHGYDWANKKNDIHSNQEFWINKIERNIKRASLAPRLWTGRTKVVRARIPGDPVGMGELLP